MGPAVFVRRPRKCADRTDCRPAPCLQHLGLGLSSAMEGPIFDTGVGEARMSLLVNQPGSDSAVICRRFPERKSLQKMGTANPRATQSSDKRICAGSSLPRFGMELAAHNVGFGGKRRFPTFSLPAATTGSPAGQSEPGVRTTDCRGCIYHPDSGLLAWQVTLGTLRDFGKPVNIMSSGQRVGFISENELIVIF